jgi:hypothetical protein
MTDEEELRQRNARLRDKIAEILETHPELRDAIDAIPSQQDLDWPVEAMSLERTQACLLAQARAIVERRPDLERFFDD